MSSIIQWWQRQRQRLRQSWKKVPFLLCGLFVRLRIHCASVEDVFVLVTLINWSGWVWCTHSGPRFGRRLQYAKVISTPQAPTPHNHQPSLYLWGALGSDWGTLRGQGVVSGELLTGCKMSVLGHNRSLQQTIAASQDQHQGLFRSMRICHRHIAFTWWPIAIVNAISGKCQPAWIWDSRGLLLLNSLYLFVHNKDAIK